MKRDLVMGWVFIAMALLMVFCIVVNCVNQNWGALPICGFAFGMNISSAINRFRDYKRRKEWQASWDALDRAFHNCWPDEDDEDEPEDNNIITD